MKIKLGCDPELFVTNREGMPRSAYGLIPGTKEAPYKVEKGAVQVDGMALEFNTDPAETEEEWVTNISTVMQQLRAMVPEDYKFKIVPSIRFNHQHLKKQPDEAKELGCMPDLNAYTLEENPAPNANTTLRTASGHIHIGFTENADVKSEEHIMRCATLAKHLDLFLGLRSLEWDKDKTRRVLYGNPGAIRIKPYGLEYRVLSNAWLEREELVRFVYKQTLACIEDLRTNGAIPKYKPRYFGSEASDAIDPYLSVAHEIKSGSRFDTRYGYKGWKEGRAKEALGTAMQLKIGA